MVAQDFPPTSGGIQTYAAELAKRLHSRVSALEVVCPQARGSRESDARVGYRVHRVPCSSDVLPLMGAPLMARLVATRGFDVAFHTQWQTLGVSALLRKAGALKRLAVAVHGKELLLRPLARWSRTQAGYDQFRLGLLRSADVLLPVSQFAAGLLPKDSAIERRTLVVPNGVDAERLSQADGASFRKRHGLVGAQVILTVARLVPRKGIDTVIASMPDLLQTLPNVHYVVVGTGPDELRLRTLAVEHGVAGSVSFLGRVPEDQLPSCYAASDVFVLATREEPDSVEGFGLVLLEASACGRPTLTTTAGGTKEAVKDGVTGIVVGTDERAELVAALRRLLQDPSLAQRLGAAGRLYARHEGSWERAADAIHAALSSAAAG